MCLLSYLSLIFIRGAGHFMIFICDIWSYYLGRLKFKKFRKIQCWIFRRFFYSITLESWSSSQKELPWRDYSPEILVICFSMKWCVIRQMEPHCERRLDLHLHLRQRVEGLFDFAWKWSRLGARVRLGMNSLSFHIDSHFLLERLNQEMVVLWQHC